MRFLFLLCGLVLGGFALLIGQNLGIITPGRPPAGRRPAAALAAETTDAAAKTAGPERTPEAVAKARAALEKEMGARRRKSLEPLAALLDEALVQQDWNKVEAVAEAITAHGGDWLEAPPPPPGAPVVAEPEERSLWQLREELDRRTRERDEARSRTAAAAIARSNDPRAKERLFDILRSPGPVEERFDAALWLVKSGDEPSIQELVRMLSADDHTLRAAAAAALGREGMVSGLSELERLARLGATPEVRTSAVDGLVGFRAVRSGEAVSAASALVQALRTDTAEEVRARAAADLFQTDLERFPLFADALTEALARDPSARVRAAAARPERLSSLDDAVAGRLSEAIVRALPTETDPSVASVFVNALAEVGDRDAALALERFGGTATGAGLAQPISLARERILARAPESGAPRAGFPSSVVTVPASSFSTTPAPSVAAPGTVPGTSAEPSGNVPASGAVAPGGVLTPGTRAQPGMAVAPGGTVVGPSTSGAPGVGATAPAGAVGPGGAVGPTGAIGAGAIGATGAVGATGATGLGPGDQVIGPSGAVIGPSGTQGNPVVPSGVIPANGASVAPQAPGAIPGNSPNTPQQPIAPPNPTPAPPQVPEGAGAPVAPGGGGPAPGSPVTPQEPVPGTLAPGVTPGTGPEAPPPSRQPEPVPPSRQPQPLPPSRQPQPVPPSRQPQPVPPSRQVVAPRR